MIYHGRDYGPVWICDGYPDCDAYVGCHPRSTRALGTPANKELRGLRNRCHATFDQLWLSKRMSRRSAYRALAATLKLPSQLAHIAMLDADQCRALLAALADPRIEWRDGPTPG